jgi:hypothetical protein
MVLHGHCMSSLKIQVQIYIIAIMTELCAGYKNSITKSLVGQFYKLEAEWLDKTD